MTLVALSARSAVVLAALVLAAAPAAAQGTAEERSACMGDAFRFCLSDIPNVAAIEACLERNERELTPACRAEFQPAKKTRLRPEHFR
ncbi:MAG: hypothetical protein GEU91_15890 [Rhizobiales bacterium]|nr:hypothetical protein [Hyphomicrobiales bacterium]